MSGLYTFSTVEDYIEYIAGIKDINGYTRWGVLLDDSPVKLASYDQKIVGSIAAQVSSGVSLTDRQFELVKRLIAKYERQLSTQQVSISTIKTTWATRKPVRIPNRINELSIQDKKIILQFTYQADLIQQIRQYSKHSHGEVKFNSDKKVWEIGLTVDNIKWACEFAINNNWLITDEVKKIIEKIVVLPLELDFKSNSELEIKNAAPSLIEYIETNCGGFDISNLITLADKSTLLGYTVSDTVKEVLHKLHGERVTNLLLNGDVLIEPLTLRQMSNDLLRYFELTGKTKISMIDGTADRYLTTSECLGNFINRNVVPATHDDTCTRIPLINGVELCRINNAQETEVSYSALITTSTMIQGGQKWLWLQNFEKIIFVLTADWATAVPRRSIFTKNNVFVLK